MEPPEIDHVPEDQMSPRPPKTDCLNGTDVTVSLLHILLHFKKPSLLGLTLDVTLWLSDLVYSYLLYEFLNEYFALENKINH